MILTILILFCLAVSNKVRKPKNQLYKRIGSEGITKTVNDILLNPIYDKLYQLRTLLNIKEFVEVPTMEEIKKYKTLYPNSEIKPIEEDYQFEKKINNYKEMPALTLNILPQPDPHKIFYEFNNLYQNNPKDLANRTVGLWVKIHQANKETANHGEKN
jgi:hypothetical protein